MHRHVDLVFWTDQGFHFNTSTESAKLYSGIVFAATYTRPRHSIRFLRLVGSLYFCWDC